MSRCTRRKRRRRTGPRPFKVTVCAINRDAGMRVVAKIAERILRDYGPNNLDAAIRNFFLYGEGAVVSRYE